MELVGGVFVLNMTLSVDCNGGIADSEAMQLYLKNNSGKTCETMKPIFIVEEYKEYPNTQVRKLTFDEIQKYMSER